MNGPALLRSVGLDADGPVLWGRPIRSRKPGVYVIELPEPQGQVPLDLAAVRQWMERVPTLALDGQRPTPNELAARLGAFWVPTESVVYVGRTNTSLGGRLAALYATPLGDRRPHAGGHWLKTLRVLDRLRIWWAETDAPEEYEDALLNAFAAGIPEEQRVRLHDASVVLPFANVATSTGDRKAHGITSSTLAPVEEAVSARQPAPKARVAKRRSPPASPLFPDGRAPQPRARARKALARERPANEPTRLSPERIEAVRAELRELTEIRRPEILARIKAARELGDLRENADYEAARNEQSFNEGRVQALESLLRNAVELAEEEAGGSGEVRVGSTVAVESAGQTDRYRIVAPSEASPGDGRLSYLSPIGRAFMGRRAGDEVTVATPGGSVVYRIVEVS